MPALKTGARLRSQVDATEVIVVRAGTGDVELLIGGHPALGAQETATPGLELADDEGTEPALIGKRYVHAGSDLEILVVSADRAGLSVGGTALARKEATPLPSSD